MKAGKKQRSGPIDWRQVHDRLERTAAANEEAKQLSPEQARALLEERARALARVPAVATQAREVIEVITFSLANETYALETRYVREVQRLADYTPLPGAPPFLVGVLNLRGDILAILDLRTFFSVEARGLTDLSRVLVLGADRAEFGVLADTAHEVRTLRIDQVLEPPDSVAGIGREYLRGVTWEALIVLDGAVLLRDSRLFVEEDKGR